MLLGYFRLLDLVEFADVVILAVKPQNISALFKSTGTEGIFPNPEKLVISIVAGIPLKAYASAWPAQPVCRVMPNIATLVQKSISAVAANSKVNRARRRQVETVLGSFGEILWISEDKLHAVTALSGSGPAYVFEFLQSLVRAGVALGLSESASRQLALATVTGSAALAAESGASLDSLTGRVTSPGGTTIAALRVLERAGWRGILIDAVQAACARSKELGDSVK